MSIDVQHVHAVAKVAWETSRADEGTISATGAHIVADAILTSTEPAVHAALLAALVRAGVLERKWRNLRPCGCRAGSNALMCCDSEAPTTIQTCYLSKWEDA